MEDNINEKVSKENKKLLMEAAVMITSANEILQKVASTYKNKLLNDALTNLEEAAVNINSIS